MQDSADSNSTMVRTNIERAQALLDRHGAVGDAVRLDRILATSSPLSRQDAAFLGQVAGELRAQDMDAETAWGPLSDPGGYRLAEAVETGQMDHLPEPEQLRLLSCYHPSRRPDVYMLWVESGLYHPARYREAHTRLVEMCIEWGECFEGIFWLRACRKAAPFCADGAWTRPSEELVLWRGADRGRGRDLTWSETRGTAEEDARLYGQDAALEDDEYFTPTLFRATVPPEAMLGCIQVRGNVRIVVDTEALRIGKEIKRVAFVDDEDDTDS